MRSKCSPSARKKAAQRSRLRGLGLVEKHVWVDPGDWPKIQTMVRDIAIARAAARELRKERFEDAARQRHGGAV